MIRLPYKWRRPEGVKKGIPKLRAVHYKLDCLLENLYIRLAPLPKSGINKEKRDVKVTISLTSFPARIHKTYFGIKSLMLQTYKADEIIIWLAESQFPGKVVPKELEKLVESGLTIRWCEDLRSHKKYFYALQEQQENQVVITYDDDIIYEADSIEKLIKAHKQYPDCIICNRGHEIVFNENGTLKPYKDWSIHSPIGVKEPTLLLVPSTGNGCLYPYGVMPEVTFDWEKAKENAYSADDIWMRFCSLQNGVKVVKTLETIAILCNVWGSQEQSLTSVNDLQGENQRVLERLLKLFPDTFNKEGK